jgi:beta-lactamase regulating signal transducer with metallopeptidase domain
MSSLFFLIAWLSNAFFLFATLALLIQGALGLLPVKNYRLRAFVRLIPGMALLLMPLLSKLKIGQFLNPLSCEGWLQKGLIYWLPTLKSYITLPKQLLRKQLPLEPVASLVSVLVSLFVVTTAVLFLAKLFQIVSALVSMRRLVREGKESSQVIDNPELACKLKEHRIRILLSDAIVIPMAIGSRTILISKRALDVLTSDELEAVIAHELAHLLAKDPWVHLFHELLRAFFWWIPMKRWLKKTEEEQEIACDQAAEIYQEEKIAAALIKIARLTEKEEKEDFTPFCALVKKSSFLMLRLEMILGVNRIQESKFWRGVVPLLAGPLVLLSCTI